MAIESWIDTLALQWELDDGMGGTVKAFRVYEKDEFPEALPPDIICALTFIRGVNMQIAAGGGKSIWKGTTEFHFPWGVDKSHYPDIMLFFARIRTAMAGALKLGGLVDHFIPDPEQNPQVQGPISVFWGQEAPHHAIIVFWEVKEDATDTVTI